MFKILLTPEQKAFCDNANNNEIEYKLLMKGKITVRWLQHSAAYFIYSGNTRPSIQGFENEFEAAEWLELKHGIKI